MQSSVVVEAVVLEVVVVHVMVTDMATIAVEEAMVGVTTMAPAALVMTIEATEAAVVAVVAVVAMAAVETTTTIPAPSIGTPLIVEAMAAGMAAAKTAVVEEITTTAGPLLQLPALVATTRHLPAADTRVITTARTVSPPLTLPSRTQALLS